MNGLLELWRLFRSNQDERRPLAHVVEWFVERRYDNGNNRVTLDLPRTQLVSVEDRDDEQRVELEITDEDLRAALALR